MSVCLKVQKWTQTDTKVTFHVSNLGLNIIEIKTTFTTKLYLKQNILNLSLGDPAVEVTRNHDINAGI